MADTVQTWILIKATGIAVNWEGERSDKWEKKCDSRCLTFFKAQILWKIGTALHCASVIAR